MLARTEAACLVIADISGYTGYLAGVELDHAQDVLADLMGTVVSSLRPAFRLAKVEGDAAFVYVTAQTLDASALMDSLEQCHSAFRRRLRDITQSSNCQCNACVRIPVLGLKIVAHHGLVARQRIAGSEELVGSDVILLHRLLKNSVDKTLGHSAYAMYTDACVRAMGVADPASMGLVQHHEDYEHIGEVTGWVADLEAAWKAEQERTGLLVSAEDAIATEGRVLPAPQEIVWEYVTSPVRRPQWQGSTEVIEQTVRGRRGVGTVNHCMHGKSAVIEEVLDWRPYEHLTLRSKQPIPGLPTVTESIVLEPAEGGTQVEFRVARPRSLKDRSILSVAAIVFRRDFALVLATLEPIVAEEASRRAEQAEADPGVPPSAGRFLSEPLAAPLQYVELDR